MRASSRSSSLNSGAPQRKSKLLDRRRSGGLASLLPGPAICTELPALRSFTGILDDDAPAVHDLNSEIKQLTAQLERSSSPRTVPPKEASSQEMSWHVLMLGRTFREVSNQHVVAAVADVLGLSRDDAASLVATAKGKTTHILSTSSDPSEAFSIMDQLRFRGLIVQVTSEQSPICPKSPTSPKSPTFPKGRARADSFMSGESVSTTAPASPISPVQPPGSRSDEKKRPKANMYLLGRAKTLDASSSLASAPHEWKQHDRDSDGSGDEGTAKIKTPPGGLGSTLCAAQEPKRTFKPHMLRTMIESHRQQLFGQTADKGSSLPSSPRNPTASEMWNTTLEQAGIDVRMSHEVKAAREICDIVRFWLFGAHWALKQTQDGVYKAAIGTKDEVQVIHRTFLMIDSNNTGHIEKNELDTTGLELMESRFKQLKHMVEVSRREHANAVALRGTHAAKRVSAPGRPPADPTSPRQRRRSTTASFEPAEPVTPRSGRPASSAGRPASSSAGMRRDTEPVSLVEPGANRLKPASTVGITLAAWVPANLLCAGDLELAALQAIGKLAKALLRKKSSFSIEDLFRVTWITSTPSDVQTMKAWCKEFAEEARAARVPTPPLLRQGEVDELKAVFRHYDDEGNGELTFDRLVEIGIIARDQIQDFRREWDLNQNGVLDMNEFLDMMCPTGYRANKESRVSTLKDGSRIWLDETVDYWRLGDFIQTENSSH